MTTKPEISNAPDFCCDAMKMVIQYAEKATEAQASRMGGLQWAHVFSTKGGYVYSPLVYSLPSRGRGKAREKGTNIVVAFCPFCGKKRKGRPDGK